MRGKRQYIGEDALAYAIYDTLFIPTVYLGFPVTSVH